MIKPPFKELRKPVTIKPPIWGVGGLKLRIKRTSIVKQKA